MFESQLRIMWKNIVVPQIYQICGTRQKSLKYLKSKRNAKSGEVLQQAG